MLASSLLFGKRINMSKLRNQSKGLLEYIKDGLVQAADAGSGSHPLPDSSPDFDPEQTGLLLLKDAMDGDASDLHFDSEPKAVRVRMRIDGSLHDCIRLPKERGSKLIRYFKTLGGLDPVVTFAPEDTRIRLCVGKRPLDMRIACAPGTHGDKLTLRLLKSGVGRYGLDELGLQPEAHQKMSEFISESNGMCLVAGPTGAGKTTTLYAILRELNRPDKSIITVEDPVESILEGVTQIEVDRDHGLTFTEGIKTMLRLDPDYLLLGEIRDQESIAAAVRVSLSGRILLSSMHSRDTAGVISTLRNWDIRDDQIATVIEMIVSQRLVKCICKKCKTRASLNRKDAAWLKSHGLAAPKRLWRSKGCKACRRTGYRGRTGVFEIWRKDGVDEELIHQHAPESEIRRHFRERGFPSLLEDAVEKVNLGITSMEEVRRLGAQFSFARRPRELPTRKRSRKVIPKT